MSLPTALALAKLLEIPMPAEIDVLTVEASDVETLSESLTPSIEKAVEPAVNLILYWLKGGEANESLEDRTAEASIAE